MSRRRELDQRLRKLEEIGEIMRSMKNLALMETRKLARFLEAQEESVRQFEAVAADFLRFHPQFSPQAASGKQALLLIGAERGFCGDFNEELLKELEGISSLQAILSLHVTGSLVGVRVRGNKDKSPREQASTAPPILAVGSKLCARLEKHPALFGQFDGPTVAEDVPATLNRLVLAISRVQQEQDCQGLTVVYHRSGADGVIHKPLLPPFIQASQTQPVFRHPPLLNLAPEQFFADLVRHYLFAALHEIFHSSLMAENQRRIQHLEGAIQRLEEKNAGLARQSRTLRQEEITEEIEVILLSVEGGGYGGCR